MSDEEGWFCVQTKPNRESYARTHLERQGFETYLPFVKIQKTVRKKIQWVIRPMFSRYLFIKSGSSTSYSKVESTLGVSKLVKFGDEIPLIPNGIIHSIKEHCELSEKDDSVMTIDEERFETGCQVKVLDGPYQGIEAIFCRYTNDQERIGILLEMMQNIIEVEIDQNIIERS